MPSSSTTTEFQVLADAYLKAYHAAHPIAASSLGFHEYDGQLPDISPDAVADRVANLRRFEQQFSAIGPADLDDDQAMDYAMLKLAAQEEIFEWEELCDWRRNPMFYSYYCDVTGYLKRDYAPLDERLRALSEHLAALPTFLEIGWANLKHPIPATFVSTAIEMFEGHVRFLNGELMEEVTRTAHPDQIADIEEISRLAGATIEGILQRLRTESWPEATDDFAIGADRFRKMLRLGEMVDVSQDKLLRLGQEDLARNEAEFAMVARQIDATQSPREVIQALTDDHPTEQSLIADTRATLNDLARFVRERNLVSIPSDTLCVVRETPPFLRWAFAMLDSPGAFEQRTLEAFYYVTPVEETWSASQKEEWLRKFDYCTLQDVSIHEAYPGHYVHYLHYRQTPSAVRKTFGAYSFWEGWAHYVEQMMLEEGFGDGDPHLRLAQLSEALVRNCRFLAAIQLHTGDMTVEDATRLFVEHAYMDDLPARKEAERGTFDPGYLNYTLGKLMLLKLRADYEQERANAFSLGAFHDQFLSFGAPPIPLVRQRMLRDGRDAPL